MDYKKNDRFSGGGRKSFNRDSRPPFRGGGRDFGSGKELFDAECANCHKMTQVPFKPNGMKPVYCRDCFKPDESRDGRAPRFEKREFGPRPFNREAAPAPRSDSRLDDLKRQMDTMNVSLQRLVSLMESANKKEELSLELRKHTAPMISAPKKEKKAKVVKAKKAKKK